MCTISRYLGQGWVILHVGMVAITGYTHIWSSPCSSLGDWLHIRVTGFQTSCKALITWQGTRILVPVLTTRRHTLLLMLVIYIYLCHKSLQFMAKSHPSHFYIAGPLCGGISTHATQPLRGSVIQYSCVICFVLNGQCSVSIYRSYLQGSVLISDKTSNCKTSQSLETARFVFRFLWALWKLTGTSIAVLPMCLSSFKAIQWFKLPI